MMPTASIFAPHTAVMPSCPQTFIPSDDKSDFQIWYENLPVVASRNPYAKVNSRCYDSSPNHRHSLGRKRLQDIQKLAAKLPHLCKKKPGLLCHLCYCFARLAGQKSDKALLTVRSFNRRIGSPFTAERLEAVVASAAMAASSNGKYMYNYSNKTLVSLLGLEPYEAELRLKTIMSDTEVNRRKNERKRKKYAKCRAKNKSMAVKKRRYSLFLRLIRGQAVGESMKKAYQRNHAVKASTFYSDLQRCRTLLAIVRRRKTARYIYQCSTTENVLHLVSGKISVCNRSTASLSAFIKRRRRC